jgi:hypothetical protein
MNSRRARQLATQRLAAAARLLASEAGQLDELTDADRLRMQRAFGDLAHEMEARSGLAPRARRVALVDPGQAALFTIDREDQDHAVRSESAG